MRIVFSRKGFDSTAGGCPSPLLEDRPRSLPIPSATATATTFGDLPEPLPDLVRSLTRGRFAPRSHCHLDPDIDADAIPRTKGWRGAFGQVGAAQGHLRRQGITAGDLFLFWGLFRCVQRTDRSTKGWHFVGHPEHRIFGWLQVGDVLHVGEDPSRFLRSHPWLSAHPHLQPGWHPSNTVYVATDVLTLEGRATQVPGFGCFEHGYRLTHPESAQPSLWRVPGWLNPLSGGTGMTYHPLARWRTDDTVRTAARGQEFVAHVTGSAQTWLAELFSSARGCGQATAAAATSAKPQAARSSSQPSTMSSRST